MCGFIGSLGECDKDIRFDVWERQLRHRGPDDFGQFKENNFNVAHSRLAILGTDLASSQPMLSPDGRYVLVYNGEIYNFKELRSNLIAAGAILNSNGDTEVLLQGFLTYGISFLDQCIGMFALAIYDRTDQSLWLARDRSGQKPLFIRRFNYGLMFSSEQAPLIGSNDKLSEVQLNEFMWFGFLPNNKTLVECVREVDAGHAYQFDCFGNRIRSHKIRMVGYKISKSRSETTQFIDIMAKSIDRHLLSDRKTCLLLSGGMDSALIAAVCGRVLNKSIDCVTMGIKGENANDESSRAQSISELCNHSFFPFEMRELEVEDLKKISGSIDTPVIDSSFLPMFRICNIVRQEYTVGLTGDGADELFGGYLHHKRILRLAPLVNIIRKMGVNLSGDELAESYTKLDKWKYIVHNAITKDKLLFNFYFSPAARKNLLGDRFREIYDFYTYSDMRTSSQYIKSLANDYRAYLQKDILVKSDRMGMMNSLELRAPFLDDELVSFSHALGIKQKVSKKIIRDSLKKLLPEVDFNRKYGFSIPISHWLKKPDIEAYVFELLSSTGLFDKVAIEVLRSENRAYHSRGEEIYGLFVLACYVQRNEICL